MERGEWTNGGGERTANSEDSRELGVVGRTEEEQKVESGRVGRKARSG